MDKYKLRMKFERSHFTDADNNVTGEITQDYAEYLENELLKAINYTRCCCKLKDKEKMTFEEWRKANKFKHIYGYYYKNDDKLNHEQVQQIYIEYLKNL